MIGPRTTQNIDKAIDKAIDKESEIQHVDDEDVCGPGGRTGYDGGASASGR